MTTTALATTQPAPSGFALIMSPQTVADAQAFCQMLSKTEFVPKAFRGKPDSIMVVGAMGARLGIDVFSAMAGIADINGKPSIYGDLMLAVCVHSPGFVDCVETFEGTPYEETFRAVCVVTRKGREPVTRSFSVIEAKEAQLWKKAGPWTATPQRMLQMRARAFALRDTFPDTLAGMMSREEMEDAIDVSHERVSTVPDAPVDPVDTVTSGNATGPAAGDEPVIVTGLPKDITVEDIQKEMTALWKLTPGGKEKGKALMAAWKLGAISEMGGSDQEQRAKFLVAIEEARTELVKGGAK